MKRTLRIIAEFLAAFLALVVLVLALAIWRLNASPVNSAFLTPYVESGIESYIPQSKVFIMHTLITWDNNDHSIALHTDDLVIKNDVGDVITEVPTLDIRLSVIGLAVGQFWPTEMTISHPQIKLDRHPDGRLYFADTTGKAPSDSSANSREALKKAMDRLAHAYAMRHLAIYNAVIEVHDDVTNTAWTVSIPEVALQRHFTQLTGEAKIDLTQKDKPASLELQYAYDRSKSLHRVSTRFKDITPSQLAGGHPETLGLTAATIFDLPITGETELAFDPKLNVAEAAANLHGGAGILHAPDMWDKPRSIKSFDVEGDFDAYAHKLNVSNANFNFDEAKLSLAVTGRKAKYPEKYDLDFTLSAHIENWPMDQFSELWPKPVIPNAREWMAANLAKGMYDKGDATFDGSLKWDDLADVAMNSGKGKIIATHGWVSYIPGMPQVENVNAEADFTLKDMNVAITQGGIGALRIQPFTITITGLDQTDQFIDIPLKVAGPIPDVLKLIDHEPLRYAHAVGLPADALTGNASGTINLHFPLLKALETKDIDVTGTAELSNVASTQFVKGLELTQGEIALTLDKDSVAVKGPVQVNTIPVQLSMQQYFHEMKDKPLRNVDMSGSIKDDQWKAFGSIFTDTHGTGTLTLHIAQPTKKETIFTGTMDFIDADLNVRPLNWKKPAGAAADVQFNGAIAEGKDITVQSITLHGPQANVSGKAMLTTAGSLKSAQLEPLVVGRSNATINVQTDADGGLHVDIHGKSLDVAGLKGGSSDNNDQPQEVTPPDPRTKRFRIKVDRLYTSDAGFIDKVDGVGERDGEGWNMIKFQGMADGGHPMVMNVTPQPDGSRSFLLTCDDFGKMLKGLGFTDTVKDGDVKIEGASAKDDPHAIEGTVKIGSFSVGNLPVLAVLLNATTPFGFVGLVTNQADFQNMNGKFRWSGDTIDLKHINIPGMSVGINVNGKVDMNSGRANLNGTIVPFSIVNRILGSIPVIGDLLTGGDGGGVLAVAYNIKGSLGNPDVNVNPVSLLTPGFLRNLFFGEGGDDADEPQPVTAVAQ